MNTAKEIMKNILKKFWKYLDKTTSNGTMEDFQKNGCEIIEDNTVSTYSHSKNGIIIKQIQINDMNTNDKTLYQWLTGDKSGTIVELQKIEYDSDDEITYLYFENGDRVNADLVGEVVIKLEEGEDGFIIKREVINDIRIEKGKDGTEYEIPGPDHGKVIIKKIPKHQVLPKQQNVAQNVAQPITPSTPSAAPKVTADPVIALLEKAKKEEKEFTVKLSVDVIKQSLYDVITENYDDGEEKSLDYIVSLIDINDLKSQLREKLKIKYNEQKSIE